MLSCWQLTRPTGRWCVFGTNRISHLAPSEVEFVLALRKGFQSGGQFIATSHNPEAISVFSRDNTLLLHRKSHLEPTIVRPLHELELNGDLVGALIRGDVEP